MLRRIMEKRLAPSLMPEELVLDIETSGLDRHRHAIYLVGIRSNSSLEQWVISSRHEEARLLSEVLPRLSHHRILTWNGDAFDLPFLETRAAEYHLALTDTVSLDWYAFFRKNRHYYDFPNLRLSTFQQMAGQNRKDKESGEQIASLFLHLENPPHCLSDEEREEIFRQVLLHNREDVLGLTELLPFLQKLREELQLIRPSAILEKSEIRKDFLIATYLTKEEATPPVQLQNSFGALDWQGRNLILRVPIHSVPGRLAVVSPTYAPDAACPPLPSPFLTIRKDGRLYAANLHQLVCDLFRFL